MAELTNEKPSAMAAALMKLWYSLMWFSTITLGFDVWVLKDAASLPYVALGLIALCLPTIARVIRSINHYFELRREHAELKQKLELKRITDARIRERARERESLEQEELYAQREAAEGEALKDKYNNVNMAAFKPK